VSRSSRGVLWKDDGTEDYKRDIKPIRDATVRLYNALISPVQADVDHTDTILLVPAAELYYLPIHALGTESADGGLSFLIERKRFAYLASASLLNTVNAVSSRSSGNAANALLALGNPDGSLPAATEEVSALGKIFSGARIITGKDATVASVSGASGSTS